MINVAVSKNTLSQRPDLKEHIESHLDEQGRRIFRVNHINDLKSDEHADIFLVNLDNYQKIVIDNTNSFFILAGNDLSRVVLSNNSCNNYFIQKPIDYNKVDEILFHIRRKIQNNYIIIKTTDGDRKLQICDLNYIDIRGRAPCFHLASGIDIYGKTLIKSFKKTISPLHEHELLYFIEPSLLINISKIKMINNTQIYFDNDDWLAIPAVHIKAIHKEWENYYDFDNNYKI